MAAASNSEVISHYANRFTRALSQGHTVASPLGLWLLLALLAPATEGLARDELENLLGATAGDAADRAAALLGDPHPAVSALVAVWDRTLGSRFGDWARLLPGAVDRGPVPSQAAANDWARTHTNGLIDEFPLKLDELTRLVLASALATDITWSAPLETTAQLGGEFGSKVGRGLTFGTGMHLVAETEAAGQVAVAAPPSASALEVLSVIAAPDVAPHDVAQAAHQVAAMLRGDEREARRVPVDELAAQGHAWAVTEERTQRAGGPPTITEWRSFLPAWAVVSDHDLRAAPGMPLIVDALSGFARPEDQPVRVSAVQTAAAAYRRTGFTAAAVTAVGVCATGMPSFHEVLVRKIELRFNRPYAVLACAARDSGPTAWRGVPVFSAWITEPQDVEPEKPPGQPVPVRIS